MQESSNNEYIAKLSSEMVKNSTLGLELSVGQCSMLAKIITVRGLESGEFLLDEGHKDDSIHVIASGKLGSRKTHRSW